MKTRGLESLEKRGVVGGTLKGLVLSTALLGALSSPTEAGAKTLSSEDDGVKVTEVAQQGTGVEEKKDTINLQEAIEMVEEDGVVIEEDAGPRVEPDPDDDKDQGALSEDGKDQTKEKSESGVSLSRQSGVGYSITGGKALWVNRFVGRGTLFKGKLGEVHVMGIADLDDPLHTKGSGKLILGKKLYKGISLDGDYTFTGTGGNIFRVGMGYGGQLGDGSYAVKIFPLNTNGSSISAKVSFSTKVGKGGYLSSFMLVDFDTKGYYSETEYVHQLAQGVAAFVQARLMGTMDGKFTGTDGQVLMGGLKVDIK